MKRTIVTAALVLAACLPAAAVLAAPDQPQQQQQNGVNYISGGIGADEQNAMRALRSDYNLRLTFATKKTGAYRSDVQLDITDAKGNSVLSVANTGPLVFAKLPPGTYRISAAAEGKTFKRSVKIGNAPKEMILHWESDAQTDPGLQE